MAGLPAHHLPQMDGGCHDPAGNAMLACGMDLVPDYLALEERTL